MLVERRNRTSHFAPAGAPLQTDFNYKMFISAYPSEHLLANMPIPPGFPPITALLAFMEDPILLPHAAAVRRIASIRDIKKHNTETAIKNFAAQIYGKQSNIRSEEETSLHPLKI